jgi:hypothetical protein
VQRIALSIPCRIRIGTSDGDGDLYVQLRSSGELRMVDCLGKPHVPAAFDVVWQQLQDNQDPRNAVA